MLAKYDIILGPTAPTTALKMGENLSDPLKMYLGDIYTVSVNLAGLPGISVPCGLDSEGTSDRASDDRRLLPGKKAVWRSICIRKGERCMEASGYDRQGGQIR